MHIAALNIHPIKGCQATAVDRVSVDRLGLVGDRRLMLVDGDGRFLSQREIPRLATVHPVIDVEAIRVTAPGCAAFELTVNPAGEPRPVSVWARDGIIAADQGDCAAEWFSRAVGEPSRLVYFGPRARNPVDPDYSPRADAETAFTDGYPIMATLAESLDDLNSRLAEPVPMARFRPSVVVSGAAAWSEDAWNALRIGEIICDAVKPCARCSVTTTDQSSGARHPEQEPLRTLGSFRTVAGLGAVFGQNIVPRGTGMLHVGDTVELL
ncbi:MAG: MOSC domain-containing protein [Gemmatimonadales bacterium]